MERMIQLGKVTNYAQYNNDFGYCGGDCAKSPMPDSCRRGRLHREKELAEERYLDTTAKVGADFEMEQPVPCAPAKARKLIAKMDESLFFGLALRFIGKYENDCAEANEPGTRTALANDKAVLLFHAGDDAACLHALDEVRGLPTGPRDTAFNRALCGGPCSLDLRQCSAVQDARKKALLARAARVTGEDLTTDRKEDTSAVCARGNYSRFPTHALSWDLKSFRICAKGQCSAKRHPMVPVGDLDGDGLGEYVNKEKDFDIIWGSGLDSIHTPFLIFKLFSSSDLCERGEATELARIETHYEDQTAPALAFTEKIVVLPNSRLKTFCVYETKGLQCSATGCNQEPYECADLSKRGENEPKSRIGHLRWKPQ
jgi:hypothetical protein